MESARHQDWKRRDFLAGCALLGVALAGGGAADAAALRKEAGKLAGKVSPHQALMREVAQLVIPRTATAGAGEVGVGSFVLLGLAHGLQDADRGFDYPGWLEAELDRRVGGAFLRAPLARRQAALAALDAEAFGGQAVAKPWQTIKRLVVTGYYTSQTGGAREQRYEPVPGRFDADLPADATTRAISNDWTAVDFG